MLLGGLLLASKITLAACGTYLGKYALDRYIEDRAEEEIDIDNIVKYKYIPIEGVSISKKDNVIKYSYVEGEKEGIIANIGKDLEGKNVSVNILDGNLLIGGMTGGGKSNLLNVIITDIMLTYTKSEVCFVGCDLAMSDVYYFRKYKHFIGMSTTHNKFLEQLNWLDEKIKERAKILDEANCRNAVNYNKKNDIKMSYIIFIVDELVMLTSDDKCKKGLHQIMSNSRKYGIYWIIGGQDATKETVGRCKMNCPQIIGFKTFDSTDSDTLIGKNQGLNEIIINGRCKIRNKNGITETQVFYIEEEEIEARLKHLKKDTI